MEKRVLLPLPCILFSPPFSFSSNGKTSAFIAVGVVVFHKEYNLYDHKYVNHKIFLFYVFRENLWKKSFEFHAKLSQVHN